ncbi:hypothetical protein AMAG_03429 [Allomyces macrogynus ATCC 38327]|uniref:EB1 C-terminal domain-containing protein n=1 Tax=Allomyces macrogynus (strain ATCC 38327) TaxID=578462 RepID=A0A0L0S9L5_ALLM3|nr:hypothetical protein AMAG_03429 [Allomyces macrogynus ATCC 38327]|eukprot:KNE59085.1 hypothetical protein AMAG_03429 [Allomyces macrogynus ATCC 38327]
MGESRVELLAWVNSLLQLNYTKLEQLGTGTSAQRTLLHPHLARVFPMFCSRSLQPSSYMLPDRSHALVLNDTSYCQIFDSIWGDLQLHKVKYDAKHEYEYVANYKSCSSVEKLIKCKLTDNMEFLIWCKRFHDMYYPGGHYDAAARRKLCGTSSTSRSKISSRMTAYSSPRKSSGSTLSVPGGGRSISRPGSSHGNVSAAQQISELTHRLEDSALALEALGTERDFYYSKLRDIEVLVQQEAARGDQSDLLMLIQQILYATEEGFEVPDDGAGEDPEGVVMVGSEDVEPDGPYGYDDVDMY